MTRKAIVFDGAVENVIVIDQENPPDVAPGRALIDAANASPGDSWDGSAFVKKTTSAPRSVLEALVIEERYRRLALGFEYDFGDVRGVHRIGTSEQDMRGWSEVTDLADALTAKGDSITKIAIMTDTRTCEVTAQEWADIRIASGAFRQPIWAASFAIMSMAQIPANYADNSRWP